MSHDETKTSAPHPTAATPGASPAVSVVGPDGGERITLGTTRMRVLEDGSHTGHRLAIAGSVLAPHSFANAPWAATRPSPQVPRERERDR